MYNNISLIQLKTLQKFYRENQEDKVLLVHQVLPELRVRLVQEDPKENEDRKEHLVPLDQKGQKERLEQTEDLVVQVPLDHPDLREIEVLQAYQVLLDQLVEEAHKDHKESEETQESREKKGQPDLLDFLVHQDLLDKEESAVNKVL